MTLSASMLFNTPIKGRRTAKPHLDMVELSWLPK